MQFLTKLIPSMKHCTSYDTNIHTLDGSSRLTGTFRIILLAVSSIVITALLFSCGSPGEQNARETVEEFITALRAGDFDALEEIAPFIAGLEEERRRELADHIDQFAEWNITDTEVHRSSARVRVEFRDGSRSTAIVFPLRSEDQKWIIEEMISFSTTIDVIPAEPSKNTTKDK